MSEAKFDPEQGVSAADMSAAIRVAAAYEAAQADYPQYQQEFNEVTGVWEPHYGYVLGSVFLGVNEDGDGIFEDRDRDKGFIPSDFITTPRAQWVAAWEARTEARVAIWAAQRVLIASAKAERKEQHALEARQFELARDQALQSAIANPNAFTPRGVNGNGGSAEGMPSWQARAVKIALERLEG